MTAKRRKSAILVGRGLQSARRARILRPMTREIVLAERPPLSPPTIGADRPAWAEGLTDKQVAFVEHYARHRNATQAYTAAFDTDGSYETRAKEGQRLMAD